MNEEIKRVSGFWEEKFASKVDCMYYEERLLAIDRTLQECDEILEEAGLGTGFISKQSELEYLFEDKRILWKYVWALPEFMSCYLDEPLYKALNQHATETISRIKLEDFSVNAGENNQIGITESYYDPYFGEYKKTQTKTTFRFADFLGSGYSEVAGKDGWIVTKSGCVEEFTRIFEAQYQGMKQLAEEEFEKRGITDYATYIDSFSHQGEFDHRMDKPFLSFVSSVLDITIIKPIIEACTGEDLITGEDLSDLECQLKLVFAGVDIATLGGAMGATRLSELGMKEALQTMGKTVAVEFMGNTAVCGIGAIGQAFDWPIPITIMLSLATGITVSCVGNKLVFEGEGFYREVPVEEIEEIRKVESGSSSVDEIIKGVEKGDIPLSNNVQKGNYGEMKMDAYFESQGYERISLNKVTDLNTPTHQGIDGVYYNPDGHPPYIIGEAKYGSSRLSTLVDGTPQMSDKWIIDRLENAVGGEVANDIKMEMILNPDNIGSSLVHVSPDGGIDITELIDGIKQ